jgi:hypothetical protein
MSEAPRGYPKRFNLMRKTPWLQLPQLRLPQTRDQVADQLSRYRPWRWVSPRTPARAEQKRLYRTRVQEWLRLPENRWCRVYLLLLGRRVRATQCHHYQGRRGMLLLYEPFGIAVSWEGHRWIEDHREQARALDLLCPLGRYNSPVRRA